MEARLQTLGRAFFMQGHDPRPWLDGWYPETLATQREVVKATELEAYWSAGSVPVLKIIARYDPFKPQQNWSEMRSEFGDRITTGTIDDASHALFPAQPARTAAAVVEWLEKLQAARRARGVAPSPAG